MWNAGAMPGEHLNRNFIAPWKIGDVLIQRVL